MICRRCGLNLYTSSGMKEFSKLRAHEATCTGKPKVAPKPWNPPPAPPAKPKTP